MNKYKYKGVFYNIAGLQRHPDCEVSAYELRRNLWQKKLSVEQAMREHIEKIPAMIRYRWLYMGLNLSVGELAELPECVVGQWTLRIKLKAGIEPYYALRGLEQPRELPKATKKRDVRNTPAMGGSVSFKKHVPLPDKTHTYEWLCMKRFGMVMGPQGANVRKTIFRNLES